MSIRYLHSGVLILGAMGWLNPLMYFIPGMELEVVEAIRWHAYKVVGSAHQFVSREIIHYFSEFNRRWWRS